MSVEVDANELNEAQLRHSGILSENETVLQMVRLEGLYPRERHR